MSDKPKRWTWEEWYSDFMDEEYDEKYAMDYLSNKAFHANEPLLDWQEKRIEELQSEASVSVMLAAMQTAKRVDAEIIENYELQQCKETIAKLKEALEEICKLIVDEDDLYYEIAREALTKIKEMMDE